LPPVFLRDPLSPTSYARGHLFLAVALRRENHGWSYVTFTSKLAKLIRPFFKRTNNAVSVWYRIYVLEENCRYKENIHIWQWYITIERFILKRFTVLVYQEKDFFYLSVFVYHFFSNYIFKKDNLIRLCNSLRNSMVNLYECIKNIECWLQLWVRSLWTSCTNVTLSSFRM